MLHGSIVDVHVPKINIGVFGPMQIRDHAAPEYRNFENVGFVHRKDRSTPLAGVVKRNSRDTTDFLRRISERIHGNVFSQASRLTEIKPAREFPDNKKVRARHAVGFQGRIQRHESINPDRTQITIHVELAPQFQQSRFRSFLSRKIVPSGSANCPKKYSIGVFACLQRFIRQG